MGSTLPKRLKVDGRQFAGVMAWCLICFAHMLWAGTGRVDIRAGYGYLDVDWRAAGATRAEAYQLRWGTAPGFQTSSLQIAPQTRFQITGLENARTYYVQLLAKTETGWIKVGPERRGAPTGGCVPGDVTRDGVVDGLDGIVFLQKKGRSIFPEMSKITIDWDKMPECVDVDGDLIMGEPEALYSLRVASSLLAPVPFRNVRVSLLTFLPATVFPGDELHFVALVSNQGDVAAGLVGVEWVIDGVSVKQQVIAGLEAQESATVWMRWVATPGPHSVSVRLFPPEPNSMQSGDYGQIEFSVPRQPKVTVKEDIPGWFRQTVALYAPCTETSGGSLLTLPVQVLCEKISHFEQLGRLLAEAQSLGTNLLYLTDYWEGVGGCIDPYSCWINKGEYVPRSDFGGASALAEAIRQVHAMDGRVVLYVEPFIVYILSDLGQTRARRWAMCDASGQWYFPYFANWTMCPNCAEWRWWLCDVCHELIQSLGADGLYFDSFGFQWDWECFSPLHAHQPGEADFEQGVYRLIAQVREVVRAVNPDAVVMTEGPQRQTLRFSDGSQHWDIAQILASPGLEHLARYRLFVGGYNIDSINLAAAFGYNLALGPLWLSQSFYIRTIVSGRRALKDALVFGRHVAILDCDTDRLLANLFAGSANDVVTAVNLSNSELTARIFLPGRYSETDWTDYQSGRSLRASAGQAVAVLPVTVGAHRLAMLYSPHSGSW